MKSNDIQHINNRLDKLEKTINHLQRMITDQMVQVKKLSTDLGNLNDRLNNITRSVNRL